MDRRYYILMGTVAAVFCVCSLLFGIDAQSIGRRSAIREKQELTALKDQIQKQPSATGEAEVVVAGY